MRNFISKFFQKNSKSKVITAIAVTDQKNFRIESIDALRGLVMIIMALDHTRDYFSNFPYYPLDLNHTTIAMFLVRWITHFCAPIFIFLIGIGMAIAHYRGKSKSQIAFFLLTRGIWMIIVELTVITFGWTFYFDFTRVICQIMWVIGFGMIALSGLVFLPKRIILLIVLIMIGGCNLLDHHQQMLGTWYWLYVPANNLTLFNVPYVHFYSFYPLIPWVAIPAFGYVVGSVFTLEKQKRIWAMLAIGISSLILFIIFRAMNYGDSDLWTQQKNIVFTLFSFINCTKYPPSLCYLLMTLGVGMIVMALFENRDNRFIKFLTVYGKVPFFYYVLHIYLIHLLAIALAYCYFGHAEWLIGELSAEKMLKGPASLQILILGYPLPIVLLMWIIVVAIFYPLCGWYGKFKARHKNNVWLSYL